MMNDNSAIVLILSVSVLILVFINVIQMNKNSRLKSELDCANDALKNKQRDLENTTRKKDELLGISTGDRAIMPDYGLCYNNEDPSKKTSFTVTYEVDVLDVSVDKIKVRATGFTSSDKIANEPINKSGIIKFMEDKWVEREHVVLVVDDAKRRSNKIDEILS